MSEFQVRKDAIRESRLVTTNVASITTGEILVKIDRFAFTANNITYGVAGDRLGYWQFFPPAGDDPQDWGLLPVWGFADVVESQCTEIGVGERFYGYFPPATHLAMQPTRVSDLSFTEGAGHRAALPPAYNNYRRVLNEPNYDKALDEMRALLYPLYITSFCLWDSLRHNDWYGAEQVVVISASSKTSIGLAYALNADTSSPAVTGLTSSRNIDMVKSLDLYDQCLPYEALDTLKNTPTVIVDMSGNSKMMGNLHKHLGDDMRQTLNVGITHWDEPRNSENIIKDRCNMFFAPSHIQMRYKDWGAEGFQQRTGAFMQETIAKSMSWLKITRLDGLEGLATVYDDVCDGTVAADAGLIIEM